MLVLRLCALSSLCLLVLPACDTPGGGNGADLAAPDGGGRVPLQHRPTAAACGTTRPAGPVVGGGRGTCMSDADCTNSAMGQNGRCVFSRAGATCSYDTCTDDSTCGTKVCLCRPTETVASEAANHCLSLGNCQRDSDCGAGGYCSPTFSTCGNYSGVVGYYCHTAMDTCLDDKDCQVPDGGTSGGPGYCMFAPQSGRWLCAYSQCVG